MQNLFIYALLAAVLAFFFFLFLMLRRTFQGLREGYERGKGD